MRVIPLLSEVERREAAVAAAVRAKQRLDEAVADLLREGMTWYQIGLVLGMHEKPRLAKSAAFRRFKHVRGL